METVDEIGAGDRPLHEEQALGGPVIATEGNVAPGTAEMQKADRADLVISDAAGAELALAAAITRARAVLGVASLRRRLLSALAELD